MKPLTKEKRRELYLFNKAQREAKRLASITTEAPHNEQVLYKAFCLIWELAQEYRSEDSPHYVSKKRYEKSLERVQALEGEIQSGAFKPQAEIAVAEAREYLSLVAEYRIRDNKKCRVF
jgi:hypothetical protein